MSGEIVIECKDVSVEFSYSNLEYSTLKELVFQRLQGKRQVTMLSALKDISLEVRKGESVAFIGHNGSGKSTLLKVLAGIIIPKTGSMVRTHGRIAPMIELGAGFDGELSGLENIFLSCAIMGLTKPEIKAKLNDIITFSELQDFIHMPVKNYSSGMQARLGFACTTAVDPDILLVDEVLAVGDSNFAKKCLDRVQTLRASGTTIVLVSHDPQVIKTFCDKGYVFDKGLLRFAGDVQDALDCHESIMEERRLNALSFQERAEEERRKKLEKDHINRAEGKGDPIPEIEVNLSLRQDENIVDSVCLSRSFRFQFDLTVRRAECFQGSVSFGIALYNEHGVRISGVNSFDKSLIFAADELKGIRRAQLKFEFNQGIPLLMSGHYKVILGIHDCQLTRTITYRDFGLFKFVNSEDEFNPDRDILNIRDTLTKVTLDKENG